MDLILRICLFRSGPRNVCTAASRMQGCSWDAKEAPFQAFCFILKGYGCGKSLMGLEVWGAIHPSSCFSFWCGLVCIAMRGCSKPLCPGFFFPRKWGNGFAYRSFDFGGAMRKLTPHSG